MMIPAMHAPETTPPVTAVAHAHLYATFPLSLSAHNFSLLMFAAITDVDAHAPAVMVAVSASSPPILAIVPILCVFFFLFFSSNAHRIKKNFTNTKTLKKKCHVWPNGDAQEQNMGELPISHTITGRDGISRGI
jgi:hypothetical protein